MGARDGRDSQAGFNSLSGRLAPEATKSLIAFRDGPQPRMRALLEGVGEKVLVSAHTHIQFDRSGSGIRSVNPGSVGMPYEGRPGCHLLGAAQGPE